MSNLVNTNRPLQIQYRKGTWKRINNVQEAFFWRKPEGAQNGNIYYETAKKELDFIKAGGITYGKNNLENEEFLKGYINKVKGQLMAAYQQSLDREKKFIQQLQESKLINSPLALPNEMDDKYNDTYAKEFNKIIKEAFKASENPLRDLFLDLDFANFLASPVNYSTFSLHKAAKVSGPDTSVNEATKALINLFFNEEEKKSKKAETELKRLVAKQIDEKWLNDFIQYLETYVYGPGEKMEYVKQQIKDVYKESIINETRRSLNQLFSSNKGAITRRVSVKSADKKGISEDFERDLKNVLKNIYLQGMDKKIDITLNGSPLSIEREVSTSSFMYKDKINIKILELKEDELNANKIVNILIDGLKETIKIYINTEGRKYRKNKEQILYDYNKNQGEIRNAIIKDLQKNKESQSYRSPEQLKKILIRWKRENIRGLLGELASILFLSTQENAINDATITGANLAESGEVSMDVQVKMLQENFGLQVKNYRNLKQSNFYQTNFEVSKQAIMRKYFGKDAENYYWLLTNEKMLYETSPITPMSFNSLMENSFYRYTDNFLRVTSGDTPEDVFNRSDLYFIGDKIIPSSYLYYKLITTIQNSKKSRYALENNSPINYTKTPILNTEGKNESKVVEIKDIIKDLKARIIFKGISFNLSNFD